LIINKFFLLPRKYPENGTNLSFIEYPTLIKNPQTKIIVAKSKIEKMMIERRPGQWPRVSREIKNTLPKNTDK